MHETHARQSGEKNGASAGSSKESAEKREGEGSGASVSVAAAPPRMAIARTHGRLHGTRARQTGEKNGASAGSSKETAEKREGEGGSARVSVAPAPPVQCRICARRRARTKQYSLAHAAP